MTRTATTRDGQHELDLLADARAGDDTAFGTLASHHLPGLELYCQLMLGCPLEADQAVQETLLRGWEGLRQLAPRTSVRIWLYRLATNVCLESLEREE